MKARKYQERARMTAAPFEVATELCTQRQDPSEWLYLQRLQYLTLGLAGEAGEVANEMKKVVRDDEGLLTEARRARLLDEIGDVLWYCAMLAHYLGEDLGDIMKRNLDKLEVRHAE